MAPSWLDRDGFYTALGIGGQYITVAPEENLIFVVTSKSAGLAQFTPATLFYEYVLPAVESDDPITGREAALAELAALAGPPLMSQEASAVPELPAIAMDVSGVTYTMEANPFNTNNIHFVFHPQRDYAELSYTARESWDVNYRIGLDNVHRITETNDSMFAAIGEWRSSNTFSLKVEIVGYSTFDSWEFTFEGVDKINVTEFSITGDYTYRGTAK